MFDSLLGDSVALELAAVVANALETAVEVDAGVEVVDDGVVVEFWVMLK